MTNDEIVYWIQDWLENEGVIHIKTLEGDENPAGQWRPLGITVELWKGHPKEHYYGWGESLSEAIEDLIG